MIRLLPGTTIEVDSSRENAAEQLLSPLFLAGGLTLSQVAQLTGLEPYIIQNWVKRGFVSPPLSKRYSKKQFCRIVMINLLKDSLRIEKICSLLSYLNGVLDDETDDIIDDFRLYCCFDQVAARMEAESQGGRDQWKNWCAEALQSYEAPFPGARERVAQGLWVMLTAHTAARLRSEAELKLKEMTE
ncbi:MAG: hypothetical protein H6Q60_1481 [Oscillospiraceae bacterium]|nr:hypothetical protein [Oscillospiraceae bacterium]